MKQHELLLRLPEQTITLLDHLLQQERVLPRIVRHGATFHASDTQRVLPENVLVLKTITVEVAGRLLLWTGLGTFLIKRQEIRAVACQMRLPRHLAKQHTINPKHIDPLAEFGMLPGMVSPLLEPAKQTRVAAMVLRRWPKDWEKPGVQVALSLSLLESLLVPIEFLHRFLYGYATAAYPHIPLIEIHEGGIIVQKECSPVSQVFSPNGAYYALPGADHTVEVYHKTAKKWATYYGHQAGVYNRRTDTILALEWLDDETITSTSTDGSVHMWNAKQAIHLRTLVEPQFLSSCSHPCGAR